MKFKAVIGGLISALSLLFIYFIVVSLVSNWSFALFQFSKFWYFIIGLTFGFGVQVGLYIYLKSIIHQRSAVGGVLAVSGTTSTAAMLSCCAHYLVNILPVIGVTGIVSLAAQYQIQFFWVGLVFNIAGILYIVRKIIIFKNL